MKIGVQQPAAALKPEQEKEKAAGGDGAAGAVLLPAGAVSAGRAGAAGRGPPGGSLPSSLRRFVSGERSELR